MKATDQVTYWRASGLAGIETCRVVHSRHVFPNHVHEGIYAIGLMENGCCYCQDKSDNDVLISSGGIALINPGQVHSGVPAGDSSITYRMLYINGTLMQAAAGELLPGRSRLPDLQRMVVRDRHLQHMLMNVCRMMEQPGDVLEFESLLLEALVCLLARYGGFRVPRNALRGHGRAVRLARELMGAELDRKITLEELARHVGLSRHHFLRVFKRATGVSPHLYRTLKRIDHAKDRLRQGCPPADVALETGFVDQSHFSHKFRQLTGATPGQYLSA